MIAGRESGELAPRLIVFAECRLAEDVRTMGFDVEVLETKHRRSPRESLPALVRAVRASPAAIVHTHGYKANILGRFARAWGAPMRGLIATAHGWADETTATRMYNVLDRRTAFLSDLVTVTSEAMVARFPGRARVVFVANALEERALATAVRRQRARARFDFEDDRIVVGFLGRTTAAKGLREFLAAARSRENESELWAIAGTGDLEASIASEGLANVRHVGFLEESDAFVDAIDIFVQSSHAEGLSLALLEAMRSGRAIVATDVGSTAFAVRHGVDGIVVPPRDVRAIVRAVDDLASDARLRERMGNAARERFSQAFRMDRLQRDVLTHYRSIDDGGFDE